VAGGGYEELHNLYTSSNIIRVIKSMRVRWAGRVASTGGRRYAYRVLFRKHDCKRPLGRAGRRWENNIKMDVREIGW
jgi:hypothetical protein